MVTVKWIDRLDSGQVGKWLKRETAGNSPVTGDADNGKKVV